MSARVLAVVGTDTGVGKTTLVRTLRDRLRSRSIACLALKPFVTGRDASGRWADLDLLETDTPSRHIAAAAPYAAELAGEPPVPFDAVRTLVRSTASACDVLLVEGIGGVQVPLALNTTWLDFHAEFAWPTLVVGRAGLGTINHTLLTLSALRERGIPVAGFVLNAADGPVDAPRARSNADIIMQFSGVACLGHVHYHDSHPIPLDEGDVDWTRMEALFV